MAESMIQSHAGILTVLTGICAFFFFLARKTGWKLFDYLPPLLFIYFTPVVLSNTGVIPTSSPVYGSIRSLVLPMMLVLLLLKVDVGAAVRVLGKGIFVMLFGTLGIMVGAPIAFLIVKGFLGPEAWKAFGSLAGSWIGGTGQMAAVSEMIDTSGTEFGLAVLADNAVYVVWLPIMLGSKNLAGWFNRFTKVSEERIKQMDEAVKHLEKDTEPPAMREYVYLLFIGLAVTWVANAIANALPELEPVISTGTWRILIVTTIGIALSFTPAKKIRGSHEFAMALVYVFVARMGAVASLEGVAGQAGWFLAGAFIWIFIHGGFCLLGARLFRVDVHTAAISSAANVGGAASAPIVAAHHKESLVPVSILMALLGYAIGTYAAWLTAQLCRLLA
jgi:uncharacterized membrane protein